MYLALAIEWDGLGTRMREGGWQIAIAAAVALAPVVYERQTDVVQASKC